MQIEINHGKKSYKVEYPVGATLEEDILKFGEGTIRRAWHANVTANLRANIKGRCDTNDSNGKKPFTQEEVQAMANAYTPGQRVKMSPAEKLLRDFESLSADQRKGFLTDVTSD